MNPDDVANVLAVIDALRDRNVTGPISVWGVACTLPGPKVEYRPEPPVTEKDMLEAYEPGGQFGGRGG